MYFKIMDESRPHGAGQKEKTPQVIVHDRSAFAVYVANYRLLLPVCQEGFFINFFFFSIFAACHNPLSFSDAAFYLFCKKSFLNLQNPQFLLDAAAADALKYNV